MPTPEDLEIDWRRLRRGLKRLTIDAAELYETLPGDAPERHRVAALGVSLGVVSEALGITENLDEEEVTEQAERMKSAFPDVLAAVARLNGQRVRVSWQPDRRCDQHRVPPMVVAEGVLDSAVESPWESDDRKLIELGADANVWLDRSRVLEVSPREEDCDCFSVLTHGGALAFTSLDEHPEIAGREGRPA